MTVAEMRALFAYNEWANARIFLATSSLAPDVFTEPRGSSFASIRDTLSHIAASEWVWLQRWRGESPTGPPEWGTRRGASALSAELRKVEADRAAFLAGLVDIELSRPRPYRNLKGEDFAEPLEHQLAHVVNHSSYHRGQVATLSRQAGFPMPATDLIVFRRENG